MSEVRLAAGVPGAQNICVGVLGPSCTPSSRRGTREPVLKLQLLSKLCCFINCMLTHKLCAHRGTMTASQSFGADKDWEENVEKGPQHEAVTLELCSQGRKPL